MFRKALLPALAMALLSGCATDYTYRNGNGNGDYYYGRPQVEYRHIGGYGGFGGYGYGNGYGNGYGYGLGYGSPAYYYDRYGRVVYGTPYGYYGAPYSGRYWQHRPRVPHGGGQHHGRDGDESNGSDRGPPWRNIGGMGSGMPEGRVEAREDDRPRRQPAPFIQSIQRPDGVTAPSMRSDGDGGMRVGRQSISGGQRARVSATPEDED